MNPEREPQPHSEGESIDNRPELMHNAEQEEAYELSPEEQMALDHIKALLESSKKHSAALTTETQEPASREAKERKKMGMNKSLAAFMSSVMLAGTMVLPPSAEARDFLSTLIRTLGKAYETTVEEKARVQKEALRAATRIRKEQERTKQHVSRDRARTEQTDIREDARAATKTGTYFPKRGGSIEIEQTPTGSKTTVAPEHHDGGERSRGAQYAREDHQLTGVPSPFLSSHSAQFQEAYKAEWQRLTGTTI